MKVLLADLDGTLITTISGKTFPDHCMDMQLKPGILNALKKYKPGCICIVTNQGGVEKGFVPLDGFEAKLELVKLTLSELLDGIPVLSEVCYTNFKDAPRRKPNPGMIEEVLNRVAATFIDPVDSILMIGDMDSDKLAAERAGISYQDVNEFIANSKINS